MKNSITRIFPKAILFVLIAAMALTFCSCKRSKSDSSDSSSCYRVTVGSGDPAKKSNSGSENAESDSSDSSVITVGSGNKSFIFIATEKDGSQTRYSVKTDKKTVGEALLELKIIDGENGDYGLYVKTVGKTVLDFNKDGYYWAFYVDGEYAQKGIDQTKIKSSSVYELRASK